MSLSAPHLDAAPRTTRTGSLWISGDWTVAPQRHQRGAMHVQWEAPAGVAHDVPIVLIHGGGGQGTDWLTTPDGWPGWAPRLVDAGFACYVVDRVGHGRSPGHPDLIGPVRPPLTAEAAVNLFAPGIPAHTQWVGTASPGDPVFDTLIASTGSPLQDSATAEELDARRVSDLLHRIGPAVLITHSAGAPAGWLAGNRNPCQVVAIVAVEPQGPPFSSRTGRDPLGWGLTHAPLATEPTADTPHDLRNGAPRSLKGLRHMPVLVVTGSASRHFTKADPKTVAQLCRWGVEARHMALAETGVTGNGHGLMFEANSDETLGAVLPWIQTQTQSRRLPTP